jgi:hypothetical protein
MQVSFELTVEDFAEAWNASQLNQKQRGFAVRSSVRALVGLLLAVLGLVSVLIWFTHDWRRPFVFDAEGTAEFIAPGSPWVVLGLLSIVQMQAPRMSRRVTIVWLLIIAGVLVAVAAFCLSYARDLSPHLFFAWTMVGSFWWAYWSVLVSRTSYRATWAKATHYHGPKLLTWSTEGFAIGDDVSEWLYKWPGLKAWQETHSLILFWISEQGFFIIPKRAFPDQLALNDLCTTAALATDKKPPPAAFPVIPLESSTERK